MFLVYRFYVNHHSDIATSSDPTDVTQKKYFICKFLFFLSFFFLIDWCGLVSMFYKESVRLHHRLSSQCFLRRSLPPRALSPTFSFINCYLLTAVCFFSTPAIHAQKQYVMKFLAENHLKSSGNSSHALDRFGDA